MLGAEAYFETTHILIWLYNVETLSYDAAMANDMDDIDPKKIIENLRARAAYFLKLADQWEQAMNGIAPPMSGKAVGTEYEALASQAFLESTPAHGIPKLQRTGIARPTGLVPAPEKLKEMLRQALQQRRCRVYDAALLLDVDRDAIESVLRANPKEFVETQGWWRLAETPVGYSTSHPEV